MLTLQLCKCIGCKWYNFFKIKQNLHKEYWNGHHNITLQTCEVWVKQNQMSNMLGQYVYLIPNNCVLVSSKTWSLLKYVTSLQSRQRAACNLLGCLAVVVIGSKCEYSLDSNSSNIRIMYMYLLSLCYLY